MATQNPTPIRHPSLSSKTARSALDHVSNPIFDGVFHAIDNLASLHDGLAAVRANADPLKTREANAIAYKQRYEAAKEQAKKLLETRVATISGYQTKVIADAHAKAGIDKVPPQAAAIWETLRGMSQKDRDAAVLEAINTGDRVVIAAIVHSLSPMLTGKFTVPVAKMNGKDNYTAVVGDGERIILGLTVDGKPFLLGNDKSLRDVPESIRACRVLEITDHTAEGVFCLLNTCLAGPQTPEKAKQASFVALDVRKGMFGQFDMRENEEECVSVLVMTEFSHWEPKSVNMIKACIDYNLVVDDALIIKAMEAFEGEFGPKFLNSITKETFLHDKQAQSLATELIGDGRIFRDIKDGLYKKLTVTGAGRLIVN